MSNRAASADRLWSRPLLSGLFALTAVLLMTVGCATGEPPAPLAEAPEIEPVRALLAAGPPRVELLSPGPGEVVTSPFVIRTVVHNLELAPLGEVKDGFGHLHVVLGGACVPAGEVIGPDHVHFGDGTADLELELPPGRHEVCVQMGDGFHTALAVSETVSIVVR